MCADLVTEPKFKVPILIEHVITGRFNDHYLAAGKVLTTARIIVIKMAACVPSHVLLNTSASLLLAAAAALL